MTLYLFIVCETKHLYNWYPVQNVWKKPRKVAKNVILNQFGWLWVFPKGFRPNWTGVFGCFTLLNLSFSKGFPTKLDNWSFFGCLHCWTWVFPKGFRPNWTVGVFSDVYTAELEFFQRISDQIEQFWVFCTIELEFFQRISDQIEQFCISRWHCTNL